MKHTHKHTEHRLKRINKNYQRAATFNFTQDPKLKAVSQSVLKLIELKCRPGCNSVNKSYPGCLPSFIMFSALLPQRELKMFDAYTKYTTINLRK